MGKSPTLRRMLVFCVLAAVLMAYSFPAAAVGTAGKVTFTGYSDKSVTNYDINDGSLTVIWGKATNASFYHVKAILLNEIPSDDAYQGTRAIATLVDRDQTAFERSVSFTKSKMRTGGAKYLKVAVGAYASGETSADANWNWVGFRLTETVAASDPTFTNGSKNTVYNYNVSNGTLTVSWSAKNASHYRVKAVLLDEEPDFDSSGQTPISNGNLYGRGLSKGEEWTKTSLTFSVSDMSRAPYLKVAVGAMSDDEDENSAHWSVIGFHLIQSSADPYPAPSSGDILAVARSQIGYTGSASSSNTTGANVTSPGDYTKYGIYTGTNGQDWCASFVSWCGNKAGESAIKKSALAGPDSLCTNARTTGAVVYFNAMNDAQRKGHAYLETYAILANRGDVTPSPGDLIFFRWNSAGSSVMFSHVGIVSKVSGGMVYYIDGNGSGDVVKERSKSLTSTDIAAFCKLHGRYYVNSAPTPVTADAPTFTNGSKSTVCDFNVSNGELTVSWSATNATHYRLKAILLDEEPNFSSTAQDPISGGNLFGSGLPKGEEWTKTSVTFSVTDLSRAPYLKVAVGAMSDDEDENSAHWSVIGFRLIQPSQPSCTHQNSMWKETKAATCTEAGEKKLICDACGETLDTQPIAMLNHNPGEWITVREATTTDAGLKERRCTRCSTLLGSEEIPVKECTHPSSSWFTVREATADQEGLKERRCGVCGAVLESQPIPKPEQPAAYSAQLKAAATTFAEDGTFTVTLSLANNPGIGFIVIQNSAAQGISLQKAEGIGAAATASVTYGTNTTLSSTAPITGENGILLLTFKSETREEATLQFSCGQCFTTDEEPVTVSGTSVMVTATKRIPGDATNDGVVDGRDVLRLMKYFAGQAVTFNEANADVTGDGIVDGRDVLRLMKYFAGLNVTLQ